MTDSKTDLFQLEIEKKTIFQVFTNFLRMNKYTATF